MNKIKVSTAQFEHKSGDKEYNLSVIERLAKKQLKKDRMSLHFTNALLQVIPLPESSPKNKCWNLQKVFLRVKAFIDYNK
jgi:predicted amidohydrolase